VPYSLVARTRAFLAVQYVCVYIVLFRRRPRSALFPYTTLFRSERLDVGGVGEVGVGHDRRRVRVGEDHAVALVPQHAARLGPGVDRKSTRLNSSHVTSSYAGFCMKKKLRRAVVDRQLYASIAES